MEFSHPNSRFMAQVREVLMRMDTEDPWALPLLVPCTCNNNEKMAFV